MSGFLTWEVSPEFFTGRKGLERDMVAREKRETQKGETKWIRIKDRREGWKRETSKLLRENCVWHRSGKRKRDTEGS